MDYNNELNTRPMTELEQLQYKNDELNKRNTELECQCEKLSHEKIELEQKINAAKYILSR